MCGNLQCVFGIYEELITAPQCETTSPDCYVSFLVSLDQLKLPLENYIDVVVFADVSIYAIRIMG